MRCLQFALVCLISFFVSAGEAAELTIIKVLPHYLDKSGRNTLSPSLYERDAYQVHLRQNPEQRSALRFDVQWKGKRTPEQKLKMRVELRGVKGNSLETRTLEEAVSKTGWFSNWAALKIDGDDYKRFGELVAWRVTLWDGEEQVAEQKSFLW